MYDSIRFDFAEHFEVEESLDGTIEPTPGTKTPEDQNVITVFTVRYSTFSILTVCTVLTVFTVTA